MADAQTPLVLMRNLPVWSGAIAETDTLLCVLGNRDSVRVPIRSLTGNTVQFDNSVPADPTDDGRDMLLAADATGLYYYWEGAWRKLPSTTENWSDYTGDIRFVLADKTQEFSQEEINNVWQSLDIGPATKDKIGMVKIADGMESNDGGVPTAEQVRQYIDDRLKNITINGGGGGTATINLADYTGNVCLKGPNGETILCYDAAARKLYFGVGVRTIETQVSDEMRFLGLPETWSHQSEINRTYRMDAGARADCPGVLF